MAYKTIEILNDENINTNFPFRSQLKLKYCSRKVSKAPKLIISIYVKQKIKK